MCAFSVCRNNGSPLFLLQNMCIKFLGLDGDKELVSLPKFVVFLVLSNKEYSMETPGHSVAMFLSYFLDLSTY